MAVTITDSRFTTQDDSTSCSIQKPSVAVGDLLLGVISVASGGVTPTISGPSGWTSLAQGSNGLYHRSSIWYKIARSGEPGNYIWTAAYGANVAWVGRVISFDGADGADPFGDVQVNNDAAAGTTLDAPAITAERADSFLLRVFASRQLNTWTTPAGHTEYADTSNSNASGTATSVALDYKTTGATGAIAAATSTASVSVTGSGFSVEIRAATSGLVKAVASSLGITDARARAQGRIARIANTLALVSSQVKRGGAPGLTKVVSSTLALTGALARATGVGARVVNGTLAITGATLPLRGIQRLVAGVLTLSEAPLGLPRRVLRQLVFKTAAIIRRHRAAAAPGGSEPQPPRLIGPATFDDITLDESRLGAP
jgi:hypothetical protein